LSTSGLAGIICQYLPLRFLVFNYCNRLQMAKLFFVKITLLNLLTSTTQSHAPWWCHWS